MSRHGTFATMLFLLFAPQFAAAEQPVPQKAIVTSPNGRNTITVDGTDTDRGHLRFTITRAGIRVIGPSIVGPKLSLAGAIGEHTRIVGVNPAAVNESFDLPWGKTRTVVNQGASTIVDLESADH